MNDFTFTEHPEKNIDDFSSLDGTVKFYGFVRAIMFKSNVRRVLDFGAGRGAFWHDDASVYRKRLRDLRDPELRPEVVACDVDDAVLTHPCSHIQVVIQPGERLPWEDNSFDLIISDMTFEHIGNAKFVSSELLRILSPGGYICVRTPNKWGYVRFASQLAPSHYHVPLLKYIQPDRKAKDIFPTQYKLNSPNDIKKAFPVCNVYYYYDSAEPSYYFGSNVLYRLFYIAHKFLPNLLATGVCFFIHKPLS